MTNTSTTPAPAARHSPGIEPHTTGPSMWAVAWRLHRVQIYVLIGIVAAAIGAMLLFRELTIARLAAFGCTPDVLACSVDLPQGGTMDVWGSDFTSGWDTPGRWWRLMHIGLTGAPVALAVFAGAVIFPREFSRGTQVFALTQSVSLARWAAIKITVLGAPLIAGLLALGYTARWVDTTFGYTRFDSLSLGVFTGQTVVPAAIGLATFAVAVTVGIWLRNTVGSLAGALVLGIVIAFGALLTYPHMISPIRLASPLTGSHENSTVLAYGQGSEYPLVITSGYLGAGGTVVVPGDAFAVCYPLADKARHTAAAALGIDFDTYEGDMPRSVWDAGDQANNECLAQHGIISQYIDYHPASHLWPLRLALAGYAALLAAVALALGFWRLPRAVAKR